MAVRTLAQRLYRTYRMLGTGFVFVLFGLGAIVISVTMFPVQRLSTFNKDVARRRIQHGMRHTFRLFMETMRVLRLMSYEAHGVEELRKPGRLIVANHPTLIDVVFTISLIPEIDCIVKRGLWRNPFLRWPVSWASYIPNSEGEELIDMCAARLKQGHSLLLFPEGTRTVPGQPMHMQRGAAHIALAANAEILPVTITCEPATLFKGNPWYRVPERPFHLKLEVGKPVAASDFVQAGEPHSRSARRLTHWLLAYYGSLNDGALPAVEQVKSTNDTASGTPVLN